MSLRALNNSAMRTFIKRVSHKKQNRKLFCQPERETCSTQRRLTADWKRVCVLRVQEIKRWQAAAWVTNHWPQSDKGQWEVSIEITVGIGVASPVMWKFLFYLPSTPRPHPPPQRDSYKEHLGKRSLIWEVRSKQEGGQRNELWNFTVTMTYILSFLRLHPSAAFQTLLLTMMATPFLLTDSCLQ